MKIRLLRLETGRVTHLQHLKCLGVEITHHQPLCSVWKRPRYKWRGTIDVEQLIHFKGELCQRCLYSLVHHSQGDTPQEVIDVLKEGLFSYMKH